MFTNPWSSIKKSELKIIQINSNGRLTTKPVPSTNLITLKSKTQEMKGKKKNTKEIDEKKIQWNATYFMDELKNFVDTMYATVRKPKKLKVLTTCNKSRSVCRFLACPDIKTHCILCEAYLRKAPDLNTTNCEEYDTSFLS